MTTIIAEASKILKEVTPFLERHFDIKIPRIEVKSSKRLTRCLGKATHCAGKYEIKIAHYAYEGKTNTKAFRNTTIHELAHIVEHVMFRKFSHSDQWAHIMKVVGEEGTRVATQEKREEIGYVSAPKRKMKKYAHKCAGGCVHKLSGQKHNKLMKGYQYTCRKTGALLSMSYEVVKG